MINKVELNYRRRKVKPFEIYITVYDQLRYINERNS